MFAPIKAFTTEILFQLYLITGNLGLAIIGLTLLIRFLLIPFSVNVQRSAKKMQELKPELDKLKKKHSDKAELQKAQMELYKKYNINPLAGCLPTVVQLALFILLYNVLITFIAQTQMNGVDINPMFFWLDLRKPDPFHILPILAAGTQLALSLMIMPATETPDNVPNESKNKKVQEENKQEEDMAEMAQTMQKQMIFMMPLMTGFIAWRFASGLALYWVVTTLFSIVQQYFISGWGGLLVYPKRLLAQIQNKR